MTIIADHLTAVAPSAVSMMSARAMEMERQGRDIVRLTSGEPDFASPDYVKMAAVKAIAEDRTKYPPVMGLFELRSAIREKLSGDNGLSYQPEQVIVSSGCKQVLYNAMAATLNPGDQVLIPSPYWMSYPAMVRINRGEPVFVPTRPEDGFKIDPEALERTITPRTKWLMLNSPNNPTGAVYSRRELTSLARVLRKHPRLWILSDDIYEFLIYDNSGFVSLLNVEPELKDRVLIVNGFSKAFCMPGLRLGYGAGPVELIKAMFKIQTQSTSGACSISQWAGVAALLGDHAFMDRHKALYRQRRDLAVSLVNEMEGMSCAAPEGAFYCFVSCEGVIGKRTRGGMTIATDEDWVSHLLDEAGVAVVPGAPFGLSPYFRISFAASQDVLREGCRRIALAVSDLS